MEKIFITVVVLYALFVGIYFLWTRARKKRKKNIIGKGASIQETGRLKTNIVGKSAFNLRESKPFPAKSVPLGATSPKSEDSQENPDIFVSPNKEKSTSEVPPEELDEAFSDTLPDEGNDPMDIDYPLEYETAEENEDEPEEDEDEEMEEVEGASQAAIASGVRFEDLGNAMRTVNRKEEATQEQREAAGNTLLEIRQTDMFEQVVSGKPDARETVALLMTESLLAFHKRKDKEAGKTGSGKKAPDNFNIRDFA